jgi:hypothetical protein
MLSRREAVTSRYSCSGSPDHRIIRNGMKKCMGSQNAISEMRLFSFIFYKYDLTDTERSFLYSSCAGSPKSHRKSHGKCYLNLIMKTYTHSHTRHNMKLIYKGKKNSISSHPFLCSKQVQ